MKRALCVLLLLALVAPAFMIPASAVEEYIFYPYEMPVTLDNYELPYYSAPWFLGEFVILDGWYSLQLISSDGNSFCSAAPLYISPSAPGYGSFDKSFVGYADFNLTFSNGAYFPAVPCYVNVYVTSDITICSISPDLPADSEIRTLWRGTNISLFTLTLSTVAPMEIVLNGFGSLSACVNSVFQVITENALLASFAAAGLIIVCIPIFIELKKSAR